MRASAMVEINRPKGMTRALVEGTAGWALGGGAMASGPVEFPLAEWRRPIQWRNSIQLLLIIVPVFGLFVGAALRKAFAVQSVAWNLVIGVGLGLVGAALVFLADHTRMPAGALRLLPGRLLFTGWRHDRWDVPTESIEFFHENSEVLVIHLRGAPPIHVHRARLSTPLSQVKAAILQHAGLEATVSPPRWVVAKATARAYAVLLRRGLPAGVVALAILAIIRWWLVP